MKTILRPSLAWAITERATESLTIGQMADLAKLHDLEREVFFARWAAASTVEEMQAQCRKALTIRLVNMLRQGALRAVARRAKP